MMGHDILAGFIVAGVILYGAAGAQDVDLTAAQALYREQCSKCHGLISPDAPRQSHAPFASGRAVVAVAPESAGPIRLAYAIG